MKSFGFLFSLIALTGMMFISSCETTSDDVSPSLDFIAGSEFITGDATMSPDSVFQVRITAAENPETSTRLRDLVISRQSAGSSGSVDSTVDISGSTFLETFTFKASDEVITEEFTFTVTDRDGETATKSFTITTVLGDTATSTPLGSAQSFTWNRDGGAAGTGLSAFGLEWTSNTGSSPNFSAVISDGATRMVELTSADWALTTVEELSAAIDNATAVSSVNIPFPQTGIDRYIGTLYNGTYYILHIMESSSSSCAAGTCVEITGMSKS